MGYTVIYYPTPTELKKLVILAALWYEESHHEKPTEWHACEKDRTIVVNGNFTECYGFDQLIGN